MRVIFLSQLSPNKISELSHLLLGQAQNYGAYTRTLGLIEERRNSRPIILTDDLDEEDIFLAELGMGDFLNDI